MSKRKVSGKKLQRQRAYYARPEVAKHAAANLVAHRRRYRDMVFTHYGNACNRCGEDDPDVLCIDHKNQDGAAHRKAVSGSQRDGSVLYRFLVRNKFPTNFRILCWNCNIKVYKIFKRTGKLV